MKSHYAPSRGFTLIELLTVIAIIGILAAIIIPTTGAVQNAAKKAKTKSQFNNWVSAMVLFKQEYGYHPDVATANKVDPQRFAGALTGRTLAGAAITDVANLYGNKKKMSFYSFADSDLNDATTPTALVDAFGNTDIVVLFDRNGNGLIESAAPDSASSVTVTPLEGTALPPSPAIVFPIRAPVIFYSAGKGNTSSDIVYSWK